jgi:hypothetical protein
VEPQTLNPEFFGLQGVTAYRRCESQYRPCPVLDLTGAQAAEARLINLSVVGNIFSTAEVLDVLTTTQFPNCRERGKYGYSGSKNSSSLKARRGLVGRVGRPKPHGMSSAQPAP